MMGTLIATMMVVVGLAQAQAGDAPEPLPEVESLQEAEVTPAKDAHEAPELAPLLEPITVEPPVQAERSLRYPAGTVLYVDASSLGLRT